MKSLTEFSQALAIEILQSQLNVTSGKWEGFTMSALIEARLTEYLNSQTKKKAA